MTKDQASDLKSLIDRAKQTALAVQAAQFVNEEAERQLGSYMHKLEHPPKPTVPDGEPTFGPR